MKEIALVATYPELAELGLQVAKEMNLDVIIKEGLLEDAANIAHELKEQGYEVVISRGGMAQEIKKSEIGLSVIEIRWFSGYDMIRSLREASSIGERIALIISGEIFYESNIGLMLNLDVKVYFLGDEKGNESFERIVRKAITDGADVIIGGASVILCAQKINFPFILVRSGKEAIWLAFKEAEEVAAIIRKEQEKANRLQAILDFACEGIITIDSDGNVDMFNSAAEKLLGLQSIIVHKQRINKFVPELKLSNLLLDGKKEIGALFLNGKKQFVANKIPIHVRNNTVGAVITFQEVSQLQHLEQNIRQKLNPKGHISKYNFSQIIGKSSVINRCIQVAKEFARVDSSVLVLGETGVGKEIFVQSIHGSSARSHGPFVAVNCAALPENLLESELFGYADGAFTGARKKGKAGLFELAHGGTIFLDEVGEMAPVIQGRLLRVIEEKEVMRLGDENLIPIDVRVIAATNKDLAEMVEMGLFRADLFYRLNVLRLQIAPLRTRRDDIPLLVDHFLDKYTRKFNKSFPDVSDKAMTALISYDWPGNIRQLENFVERLVVLMNTSVITLDDISIAFSEAIAISKIPQKAESVNFKNSIPNQGFTENIVTDIRDLCQMEREMIKKILEETGNNYSKASQLLGINRTTLWRKLKKPNS